MDFKKSNNFIIIQSVDKCSYVNGFNVFVFLGKKELVTSIKQR